jgi:hypothetical protein
MNQPARMLAEEINEDRHLPLARRRDKPRRDDVTVIKHNSAAYQFFLGKHFRETRRR